MSCELRFKSRESDWRILTDIQIGMLCKISEPFWISCLASQMSLCAAGVSPHFALLLVKWMQKQLFFVVCFFFPNNNVIAKSYNSKVYSNPICPVVQVACFTPEIFSCKLQGETEAKIRKSWGKSMFGSKVSTDLDSHLTLLQYVHTWPNRPLLRVENSSHALSYRCIDVLTANCLTCICDV